MVPLVYHDVGTEIVTTIINYSTLLISWIKEHIVRRVDGTRATQNGTKTATTTTTRRNRCLLAAPQYKNRQTDSMEKRTDTDTYQSINRIAREIIALRTHAYIYAFARNATGSFFTHNEENDVVIYTDAGQIVFKPTQNIYIRATSTTKP